MTRSKGRRRCRKTRADLVWLEPVSWLGGPLLFSLFTKTNSHLSTNGGRLTAGTRRFFFLVLFPSALALSVVDCVDFSRRSVRCRSEAQSFFPVDRNQAIVIGRWSSSRNRTESESDAKPNDVLLATNCCLLVCCSLVQTASVGVGCVKNGTFKRLVLLLFFSFSLSFSLRLDEIKYEARKREKIETVKIDPGLSRYF